MGSTRPTSGPSTPTWRTHVDQHALVNTADGYTEAQARHAIDTVLADSPNATLRTQDEFKGSVANQINKMLNLVYVLLAMALVIALFGIANTLALSVFERTREFGLLRAVGMARSQVRVDGPLGVGADRALGCSRSRSGRSAADCRRCRRSWSLAAAVLLRPRAARDALAR